MNYPVRHTQLVVSSRGRITLPTAVRKRLRIRTGELVMLEERDDCLIVRPMGLKEERYTDAQIEEWTRADRLDDEERVRLGEAIVRLR